MRIISGIHRGRHIKAPGNLPVRPTTDFAKTGLFNILNNRYRFGALTVADLFAGTGSLSYEFISRGCERIVAVDKHPGCTRFIKSTFELLKAPQGALVVQADVISWLKRQTGKYDIIIADAPFDETPATDLVNLVKDGQLLNDKGCLIIEHSSDADISGLPGFRESRKYGHVTFSFFSFGETTS